jgi:hypothetical protein
LFLQSKTNAKTEKVKGNGAGVLMELQKFSQYLFLIPANQNKTIVGNDYTSHSNPNLIKDL